jgi:hypothetical protein
LGIVWLSDFSGIVFFSSLSTVFSSLTGSGTGAIGFEESIVVVALGGVSN